MNKLDSKKILFFDIDGTLAIPGQKVSKETIEAIRKARENGHYTFISTGRAHKDVPPYISDIGFDGGIYSGGGKIVIDDKVYKDDYFPRDLLLPILDKLNKMGFLYNIEGPVNNYTNEDRVEMFKILTNLNENSEIIKLILDDDEVGMTPSLKIEEFTDEPIYKINFRILEGQDEAADTLVKDLDPQIKFTLFDNMFPESKVKVAELANKDINKGLAVEEVCKILGVPVEDSISFGDSMNDYDMLLHSGTSVAMGNSSEPLKEIADIVTDTCENDGVAKAIKELGLV